MYYVGMSAIRFIATSPKFPHQPFKTLGAWEVWLDAFMAACMEHAGPKITVIVLPEDLNLPVILTGEGLNMDIARRYSHVPNLSMLAASNGRALRGGFLRVLRMHRAKLEASVQVYSRLAQKYSCYVVGCGFYLDESNHGLVNRLWVMSPSGETVHQYDKQNITSSEQSLGMRSGSNTNPFFSIYEHKIATAICLDAFDPEHQELFRNANIRAVLVPCANPRPWEGYAASGVWQPTEWLAASEWVMAAPSSILFVNSMLRGRFGPEEFHGQAHIRSQHGKEVSGFPPENDQEQIVSGFHSSHEHLAYADLV
jgi:predicted amidohydrolase